MRWPLQARRAAERIPSVAWVAALLGMLLFHAPGAAADVPPPDVKRVDHTRPAAYLDLLPTMGEAGRIRSIASQLKQERPEETLASIGRWVKRNLRSDPKAAYAWRTFDQMQKDATYGSCADHAVAFGALARACGIPTVWVKTMDVDWILAFRNGREDAGKYVGHVFLEVHLGGRWMLLDAEAGLLYESYDPVARILPGNRFAYDKGGDPYALVLSCRWEEWKAQTDAYFSRLDLAEIPWSRPRALLARWNLHVAVAAPDQGPWVREIARAKRYEVVSEFNQAFDRWIPRSRGATLVVLAAGGNPSLPEPFRAAFLPEGHAAWLAGRGDGKPDWLERLLPDGTRVLLVRAEDQAGVQKALGEALR